VSVIDISFQSMKVKLFFSLLRAPCA